MAMAAGVVSDLVGRFYAAALDSTALESALDEVRRAAGAAAVSVIDAMPDGSKAIVSASGYEPGVIESYNHHFHALDRAIPVPGSAPCVFSSARAEAAWPGFGASAFFNDWARPNGIAEIAFATIGDHKGYCRSLVLVGRPNDRNFGRKEQIGILAALQPHLLAMTVIAARLRRAERRASRFFEVLEHLPHGAVVLDRRGRVVHATARAEAAVRADGSLSLTTQGLRAGDLAVDRMLQAAISAAIGTGPWDAVPEGSPIRVPRREADCPLVVKVMALRAGPGDSVPDEDGALVLIVDPGRNAAVEPGLLRQVFGLTGAEATVALRVAEGHTLAAVAEELGVLRSTVRTHLQRVFEKTGTSRQSQLARLVIQCG